jgi:hypothetical protein
MTPDENHYKGGRTEGGKVTSDFTKVGEGNEGD